MKQILIVDAAHENDARRLFPSLTVQTALLPEVDGETDAILWCHNAIIVAEDFCRNAAQVRIVSDAKMPPSFNGRGDIAKHYVRHAMTPWKAPETSHKANGHGPAPAEPEEPREAPAAAGEVLKAPKTRRKVRERTEGTSWADFGLVLNDKGIPVTCLDNCVHVLERHPDLAGNLWYDNFLIRILHTWGTDSPREWSDYDDVRLALFYQRDIGIPRVSKGLAHDAVIAYSMRETRNCAYDWLDGLQWDGKFRLDLLATLGFGAEPTDYTAKVCRNLILSMVKRVFSPGCKSDYMPIFEGEQGEGKSKALAILGGDWFAELHMDWNNKDFYQALQGKMLLEIGELHAFKQTDVDRIKGIVSCAVDRYRQPFGVNTQDFRRTCVFAGTTNRDDWNRDDTGARRFWPILCGKIDHAWIQANREQMFAEAVHVIRAGGSYWEVPWEDAKKAQDDRRPADTWEDAVRQWLKGKTWCRLSDVLAGAVDLDNGHQTLSEQQRMGRVMKRLGWLKMVRRIDGVQAKVWGLPGVPIQDEFPD